MITSPTYDYLLGGKDNFTAGREAGDRLIAVFPAVVEAARENRQFLARAVIWVANQGIGQFIDLWLRRADHTEHPRDRAGHPAGRQGGVRR